MFSQARIVILEDERPQLLAVRAALHGLGQVHEFGNPSLALEFLRKHEVDAAIVDIHMPSFSINGMDFIRSVRSFDKELSVIIRTGDPSSDLADGAIEVGAFRRAIKGRTSVHELRNLTDAAVAETRARRQLSRDAANTSVVKSQWVETLGSVEEVLSATESYRALLQKMRNQLTAIAGIADVIKDADERQNVRLRREFITKNKVLVGQLLANVNEFLSGPFSETFNPHRGGSPATANRILNVLRSHFSTSPKWGGGQTSMNVRELVDDIYLSVHPLRLLTALRHVAEFCLQRTLPQPRVDLAARYCDRSIPDKDLTHNHDLVYCKGSLNQHGGLVCFVFNARLKGTSIEDIRRAINNYPDEPQSGNLHMLSLALGKELASLTVHLSADQTTVFELYVPVSR